MYRKLTSEGVGPIREFIGIDRSEYERDLRERRRKHLDRVRKRTSEDWRPCAHDSCSECHGTGTKLDGTSCVHMISCPCPKCSPRMM